jgi:hypothetical protein
VPNFAIFFFQASQGSEAETLRRSCGADFQATGWISIRPHRAILPLRVPRTRDPGLPLTECHCRLSAALCYTLRYGALRVQEEHRSNPGLEAFLLQLTSTTVL